MCVLFAFGAWYRPSLNVRDDCTLYERDCSLFLFPKYIPNRFPIPMTDVTEFSEFIYTARPESVIGDDVFTLRRAPLPVALGADEQLLRAEFISVDPYQRIQMSKYVWRSAHGASADAKCRYAERVNVVNVFLCVLVVSIIVLLTCLFACIRVLVNVCLRRCVCGALLIPSPCRRLPPSA